MTASEFLFPRATLAEKLADDLEGKNTLFPLSSGVFLAAPRRTGKSTFLKSDLIPELEKRFITTIYVDLLEDKREDPGDLIRGAILNALNQSASLIKKGLLSPGKKSIKIAGLITVDFDLPESKTSASLKTLLEALVAQTHRPVALIIDEAQRAIASERGTDTLFALKAARDALNMNPAKQEGPDFMLVCTGSHRDKLAKLVLNRKEAFFGATLRDFPLLDRSFTDAYCTWINARLAEQTRLDPDDVFKAFKLLGSRPEFLRDLIGESITARTDPQALHKTLTTDAAAIRNRLWEEFDNAFGALSPLQKAVLARLVTEKERFMPFSAASLADYSTLLHEPIDASAVQAAIDALRDRDLIWRSARGQYALEEQDMADWFLERNAKP